MHPKHGTDTLQNAADTVRALTDTSGIVDTVTVWNRTGLDSILAGDGIMIALVGILIVFSSLAVMSLIVRFLKRFVSPRSGRRDTATVPEHNGVSGEVVAAIAAALQYHLFELHDEERTIITIKKVSKPYSPWSSKLYGMTPSPIKHISNR